MNTKLYDIAIKKLKEENIKCICNMDKPLLTISNAYPGVWLEHVYDSIMYAKLFNDTSKIASLFNNNEEHNKYKNMAIDIKKRLFELCYDKDDSFFYDLNLS